MYQALIVFHILFALGIIGFVMMQQGRGADAGAAFGSGASGTVFGARGAASFLTRTTAILAVLFFASSLLLATIGDSRRDVNDIMDEPAGIPIEADLPTAGDGSGTVGESNDIPVVMPAEEGKPPLRNADDTGSQVPVIPDDAPPPAEVIQEEVETTTDILVPPRPVESSGDSLDAGKGGQ